MKQLSKKVRERIINDNDVSLDLAKILGVQQYSLKELVKRNSDKLVLYFLVMYYVEKLGYTIDEIFETEEVLEK